MLLLGSLKCVHANLVSCRSMPVFFSIDILHFWRYCSRISPLMMDIVDSSQCFWCLSISSDLVCVTLSPGAWAVQNSIVTIYSHLCCLLFTSCGYYHVLGKCKWFLTVLCVVWYSIKFSSVLPGRCLFSLRKNRLCDHIPWSLVYFVGLVGYVQYSDLSNDVMRCCLPGNIFQVLQIAALLRKILSSRDSFANESSVISLLCPHGRPFKYFSLR